MKESSLESAVSDYLSVSAFQRKWERDQKIGSGYFYALTYAPIASFFREHEPLEEALETKVALVFSWNPTICHVTSDRFAQARTELAALAAAQKDLKDSDILDLDIDSRVIHDLWYAVKKATSSMDTTVGVSVTKFLHFSFADTFPMIDISTMNRLYGKTVNLKWYSVFLSDWKDLYRRSKASFDQISEAVDLPVTRVLDAMIFTPR